MTSSSTVVKRQRTNQQWLTDLNGINGEIAQEMAYIDLGRYAAVCAFNLLRHRAGSYSALSDLDHDQLSDYAMDFAQMTLEKIAADEGALLSQFRGQAAFTSWIAKITNNIVISELRKTSYRSEVHLRPADNDDDSAGNDLRESAAILLGTTHRGPEVDTLRRELAQAIATCIKQLPERERIAYWEKEINGQTGHAIAERLEASRNAIYLLLHSARKRLQGCLEAMGYA